MPNSTVSGPNAFSSRSWANDAASTPKHIMIVAESIGKEFRDKKRGAIRAVENRSFCCAPGQVYGLLGANGAGKTTAVRMLATILAPTSGTASVAGFDIRRQPEKARQNSGFLSTATALYGRLTALAMGEYFARLYGLDHSTSRQCALALFDRLHIHSCRARPCDELAPRMTQPSSIPRTPVHDL